MVNRKTNRPMLRAPDGSAFQNCDECGALVAIAIMVMHDCQNKIKFKRCTQTTNKKKVDYEEPRSPFLFFMETYEKTCKAQDLIEMNCEAVHVWQNMSKKERRPYYNRAQEVDSAYMMNVIYPEMHEISKKPDDEADSATVEKFYQITSYTEDEDFDNHHSFACERCWDTCNCNH